MKLKLGVKGRANTFSALKNAISKDDKTLWFHCASLGEYEQGLPVFEEIKKDHPKHKIILSFFSPSGFEIRKNSPIADVVVYMPLDTIRNAKKFLDLAHPELIIFVKYEIWPNFLNEIKRRNVRALLISAMFREAQTFFKWHGKWMQKSLNAFEHFFVQNSTSKTLLNSVGFNNVTVSGDTRFDRVSNQLNIDNKLLFIETFKDDKLCVVAGSTWPEGEAYLADYINANQENNVKYIIAPHNINANRIKDLAKKLQVKTVLFSEKEGQNLKEFQVFILDTIGILSKVYSYANIAYVGGAIGNTGLHNILEPAVFGASIIIGDKHEKFPEATLFINNGGTFSIKNQEEFNTTLNNLIQDSDFRTKSSNLNRELIQKNAGAVVQIMDYIRR